MGSLSFTGVLFIAYPNDHLPRHVHGFAGDMEAIWTCSRMVTFYSRIALTRSVQRMPSVLT